MVIMVCFNYQRESPWKMKMSFISFRWEPQLPSTSRTWEPRSAGGRWVEHKKVTFNSILWLIFVNHNHYHTSTPELVNIKSFNSTCQHLTTQHLLHSPPGSAFTHLPGTISTFSVHIISLTQFPHQMLISQPAVRIQLIPLAVWSPAPFKNHKLQSIIRCRSVREGCRSHGATSGPYWVGKHRRRNSNNIGTLVSIWEAVYVVLHFVPASF